MAGRSLILAAAAGALSASAMAQVESHQSQAFQSQAQPSQAHLSPVLRSPGQAMPRYQGVEQMVGDVSPLGVSLRSLQMGLGLPAAFEGVYRAPDDGTGRERLMRIDGALAATFPRSEYWDLYVRQSAFYGLVSRVDKVGHIPVVPAGTVFKIGLPESKPGEPAVRTAVAVEPARAVERADDGRPVYSSPRSSVPIRTSNAPRVATDEAIEEARQLIGSENDREQHMRNLLQRAAHAESGRNADDSHAARGRSGSSSK